MADPPKQKDAWDKFGVLLQPVGGLLTAMAVAFLGVIGSRALEERQSRDSNSRLYSELMSQRESRGIDPPQGRARRDPAGIPAGEPDRPRREGPAARAAVEQLPRLARSQAAVPRLCSASSAGRPEGSEQQELLARIENLAREITSKQLFTLQGRGARFSRPVDLAELRRGGRRQRAADPGAADAHDRRAQVRHRRAAALRRPAHAQHPRAARGERLQRDGHPDAEHDLRRRLLRLSDHRQHAAAERLALRGRCSPTGSTTSPS